MPAIPDVMKYLKSPLAVALVYLAMIPVFGAYYSCLHGAFYHSTSQFEPRTKLLRKSLQAELQKEVRGFPQMNIERGSIQWVNFSNAVVFPLKAVGESISLRISVQQQELEGKTTTIRTVPMTIDVSKSALKDETPLLSVGECELSNGEKIFLFPEMFRLNRETQKDWQSLADALEGFPAGGCSHVFRMVYFSAITIATLGYGDIVPLTDTARLVAGFECIMGMVLVGLFLNAIAENIKSKP